MATIGLLIAALAAYWVFTDCKKYGHPTSTAALWAVGTLAMMIVFLPLYLFFGRKPYLKKSGHDERTIDVEAIAVEDAIFCPMCGKTVKEEFKVCPYCSYTLKPKCESCGKELNREWKSCPYCQAPAVPK